MRKHFQKKLTIFITLVVFHSSLVSQNELVDYKVYFASGTVAHKEVLVIRQFTLDKQVSYLIVDLDSLNTQVVKATSISIKPNPLSWEQVLVKYAHTAYIKAIETAKKQSFSLQNSGIIHGFPKEKGITLTMDLCPSHKPLDRVVFTSLIRAFKNIETPVPLGLSITGKFMLTHADDISWLKTLVDAKEIRITWINHSYNHHYDPKLPLNQNFLLEAGTDLNAEILKTEIALMEQGLLPSIFFRFPGLVSTNSIVDKVVTYGFIPIGSDAWLAKGQQAHHGSIVLIHGNGNEPIGIQDFLHLLNTEKTAINNKEWLLYDLRESIEEEFKP